MELIIKSILIIRLSSMGDVILTTSTIRQLRVKFPDARIDMVVANQFKEVFLYNKNISNLIEYDKSSDINGIVQLKNSLKDGLIDGKYDIVIDLQRNLRSKIFRSGLGNRYLFVHKRRLHKLSMIYLKKSLIKGIIPVPEFYRLAAAPLNVYDDNKGLELWLYNEQNLPDYPPESRNSIPEKITRIAIAPGAFHFTKRWQVDKFIDLIKILHSQDIDIVLLGGLNDKEITDEIKSKLNFQIIDMTNSSSILNTTEAIDECDMLITNDTGVMHIAAARHIPVVAIFGSTVREFGFIPFRTAFEIVEKNLECRPCTHIGLDKCPKGHFKCMNLIEVNDVLNAVDKLMKHEK